MFPLHLLRELKVLAIACLKLACGFLEFSPKPDHTAPLIHLDVAIGQKLVLLDGTDDFYSRCESNRQSLECKTLTGGHQLGEDGISSLAVEHVAGDKIPLGDGWGVRKKSLG